MTRGIPYRQPGWRYKCYAEVDAPVERVCVQAFASAASRTTASIAPAIAKFIRR